MNNIYVTVFFIAILFGMFSCSIGEDQPQRNLYEFNQQVSISPAKKEYSIGDIFLLEVSVPEKSFQDLESGTTIRVENATFGLSSRIEFLQVDPIPEDSVLFDLILQSGVSEENPDFDQSGDVIVQYGCPENDYLLQFGYQLKAAGNYLLILNDLTALSLIIFNDETDCSLQTTIPPPDNADQAFVRYLFETDDVNLDVFNEVVLNKNEPNTEYYKTLLANKYAFFFKVR